MDPRRLVIFATVLERGSIGAAARELGWTQPAVSQHLAALEKEVGMQLLLRGSGGVTPTEAGTRLAVYATQITESVAAAQAELEEIAALKKGRVRFACFPSAAAILLPSALTTMNTEYPDIDVSFTEVEPPDAIAGVLANRFDLAMIFRYPEMPVEEEGALEWTPILADPLRLALSPTHRLADVEEIDLADLRDDDWIAGCARCRANLMRAARAAGFTPKVRYSTDDSTVTQRLIHHDPSVVSLMPEIALEASPNANVRIKKVAGLEKRQVGLVNRPGALNLPAAAAFMKALQDQAAAHSCSLIGGRKDS